MLLEVIVQTPADARAAEAGGADRLEIVRDLAHDGLTPSLEAVRAILSATNLPARTMVRQRDAFTLSGPRELASLQRACEAFAALGLDGAVLGFTRDGNIDQAALDAVLHAAQSLRVTFHRAFDSVDDPAAGIRTLKARGQIDRILTSGGFDDWPTRRRRLERYALEAEPDLIILAGGGMDEARVRDLASTTAIREVHVGRAARLEQNPQRPVCAELVRRLREAAQR